MNTTPSMRLSALSHRPQRQMLVALSHHNPQDDTPIDSDDPEVEDEKLETLLDFRNYHLPKLESEGLIDYDRENNIVTKGPNFDQIEPLVELIAEHQDELPDDWL